MVELYSDTQIQQYYINNGCSVKELAQKFNISINRADILIMQALKVVKNQIRIERMLDKIEMSEEENEI